MAQDTSTIVLSMAFLLLIKGLRFRLRSYVIVFVGLCFRNTKPKVIEKLQFPAIYFHRHGAIKDRINSV